MEIIRLEYEVFNCNSKEAFQDLIEQNLVFKENFLFFSGYPNDSMAIEGTWRMFRHPAMDSLYQNVQKYFPPGLPVLGRELLHAFKLMKHYYPDWQVPQIKTCLSGIQTDLYLSDSLIAIGLDYFLGPSAKWRPNLYKYILKRFDKPYVVPQIMLLIANNYNQTNHQDKTALAEMIYYGKAFYFAKKMLPCTADSLLMGYTAQNMIDIKENEEVIWANLVQNQVLYETSYLVKKKFIQERPIVNEIGTKCPGRIGQWVGWQIVEKYAEQTGASLQEIMEEPDAQKIFKQSRYKPS